MGTRVFIGKIPFDANERSVKDWLADHGFKRTDFINVKRGFAFVDFRDSQDAENCIEELNGSTFMRTRISVEMARGSDYKNGDSDNNRDRDRDSGRYRDKFIDGPYREKFGAPYNTKWRLIVKNLSSRCEWRDLKDFFRQVGTVTYAESHKKRTGEGIVDFAHRDEVSKAISRLNGTEFMGRIIQLSDAIATSSEREDSGAGGVSPFSRRRRSRSRSSERSSQRKDKDFSSRRSKREYSDRKDRYSSENDGISSRYRRERKSSDDDIDYRRRD